MRCAASIDLKRTTRLILIGYLFGFLSCALILFFLYSDTNVPDDSNILYSLTEDLKSDSRDGMLRAICFLDSLNIQAPNKEQIDLVDSGLVQMKRRSIECQNVLNGMPDDYKKSLNIVYSEYCKFWSPYCID